MIGFSLSILSESKIRKSNKKIKKKFQLGDKKYCCVSYDGNEERISTSESNTFYIISFSRIDRSALSSHIPDMNLFKNDAEIIEFLFEKFETNSFKKIAGNYSFIIINKINSNIYAVTDHINSYPLFYFSKNEEIYFSFDPNYFFKNFSIEKELDEEILLDYLVCGLPRKGRTIYKNIFSVPSRFFLFQSEDKKIKFFEYFSFRSTISGDKYLQESTRNIFLKTLDSKLDFSNKEIACMLSGGVDSSSITCGLDYLNKSRGIDVKIKTFSAIFKNLKKSDKKKADESIYIDEVNKNVNSEAYKISFDKDGPIKILDKLSDLPEPAVAPNLYINDRILSELKLRDIKYLFDGSGGDSVIGHGLARFLELGKSLNIFDLLKEYKAYIKIKGVELSYLNLIKRFILKPRIPHFFQKKMLLKKEDKIDYFNPNIFLKEEKKFNAFKHFKFIHGYYPYIDLKRPKSIYSYEEVSYNSLFASYSNRVSFHLGNKYGVEIIMPFYSKGLMNHCLNVPLKEKMKNGVDRSYFRKSLEGILPEKIVNRLDKGDLSPVFRNEFRRLSKDKIVSLMMGPKKSYFRSILDQKKIEDFIDDYHKNPNQQVANMMYKIVYLTNWVNRNFK